MSQLLEKIKFTLDGLQTRIASLQADRDILAEALHALAGDYGKKGEIVKIETVTECVAVDGAGQYMTGKLGTMTADLSKAARFAVGAVNSGTFHGCKLHRVVVTTVTTMELLEDDISG